MRVCCAFAQNPVGRRCDEGGLLRVMHGALDGVQDYSHVVATHRQTGADVTIVTHSIEERDAGRRGVMRVNPDTGAPPKAASCAPIWHVQLLKPVIGRSSVSWAHRQ